MFFYNGWQLTNPQSNCGLFLRQERMQGVFSDMVVRAFNSLPAFLQPRVEDQKVKASCIAKPKNKKRM